MASLFELTGEALTLQRQIDSAAEFLFSDDPAEVSAATATLETLINAEGDTRKAIEAKADAWCWVIDQLRAQSSTRAAHAQRLRELAAVAEHHAEVLQDRLVAALMKVDPIATRWELASHKLTSRSTASVQLDPDVEPASLPDPFVRVQVTYTANKVALATALKAGVQIEGAALVHRRSWSIK